jgi:hypothetical protein
MILTKNERLILRGARQDIISDEFYITKGNEKTIEGVDFKPGFKHDKARGQDLSHSEFVHQLFELAIDRMPDGVLYKGKHLRDATGPRLEAISENNWVISLCVGKLGGVFYSLYYRGSSEEAKKIIINNIKKIYPGIERKENSLDLIVIKNGFAGDFNDERIIKCVDDFWIFVNNVSKIKEASKLKNNFGIIASTGSLIKRKKSVVRYYLAAAISIYSATRFAQKHMLPRGGGDGIKTFDAFDEIIAIGATEAAIKLYSKNGDWGSKGIYREHAVPCKLIVDQAIKTYQNNKFSNNLNKKIIEVALMIRRNLVLVYCTTDEAQKLDARYRSTMPEGWNFKCGNVLDRFHACDIPIYTFDGYQFIKS